MSVLKEYNRTKVVNNLGFVVTMHYGQRTP